MTRDLSTPIDLWVDIICPWCLIALTRLDRAASTRGLAPSIRFRAFRLHQDWPAEGMSWRDFQAVRNLPDTVFDHVTAVGRGDGLDFDFRRIARVPDTTNLHRALIAAGQAGLALPAYRALTNAYFFEEADLSDPAAVVAAGIRGGLARDTLEAALVSPTIGRVLLQDELEARSLGVRGVPFLRFSNVTLAGAQPVTAYAQLLEQSLLSAL